tara:strand:- start:181 stop:405 length:225 start_codon:yes stop_codon:yes gene_type:complete
MLNDAIVHHINLLTRLELIMYETLEEIVFCIEGCDLEIEELEKRIAVLQRDRQILERDRLYFISKNKTLYSKEQ